MKQIRLLSLPLVLILASVLFACGGATPTPVPPTAAPTAVPPTTAPTAAPTTAPTTVPTAAPTTASGTTGSAASASAVADAFKKFAAAENFNLKGNVSSSPAFFAAPYTPGPNDDPENVLIVSVDGKSHGTDIQYKLGGFLSSFVGVFMGFDPTSPNLEMVKVGDKVYMRGVLEGQSEAKWYLLPEDQASSMSFKPQDIVHTVTDSDFAAAKFTKEGTKAVAGETCDVYAGDRAAFDVVLPKLEQEAGLNTENIDPAALDSTEFKVIVCPDGNVHGIVFTFAGPVKSKPSDKAKFAYEIELSGYADSISVSAPADAEPLPASANPFPPSDATAEPTETSLPTGNFSSYDGEWRGKSASDSTIEFTVEGDKITFANMNYAINTGGCSFSGTYATSPDDSAIENGNFTAIMTNSDDVKFVFAGTFDSNNEAHGTLDIQGKTFCGDTNESLTWTAKHVSSPEGDGAEPTEEPSPEATIEIPTLPTPGSIPTIEIPTLPTPGTVPTIENPSGGGTVVEQMFAALNAGNVNAALALFQANAVGRAVQRLAGRDTDAAVGQRHAHFRAADVRARCAHPGGQGRTGQEPGTRWVSPAAGSTPLRLGRLPSRVIALCLFHQRQQALGRGTGGQGCAQAQGQGQVGQAGQGTRAGCSHGSFRSAKGESKGALVAGNAGVTFLGPGVDAASDVGHLGVAMLRQEIGHLHTASTVVAQAGNRALAGQFLQAHGYQRHRDV